MNNCHFNGNDNSFSREKLAVEIQIWNRATISLVDIRHKLISPEEPILNYCLPNSMFLYTNGSKAEVSLNDTVYNMERFGLFHGGKGTKLTIRPVESWLEYYLIIYKAGEPSLHSKEYMKLIESTNPFRKQYGFSPETPIFITELLRKMYEKWNGYTPLNLFYGKTAFYQLVYEVYEELERGNIFVFEPNIVVMGKQYLDEHYGNEIVIQDLCEMLGVSYSYFYKSFKEKTGESPQEYLIRVRLSAAKNWLQNSEMPMRVIADASGFTNERNFYRTFAKHFGVSPNTFRKNLSLQRKDYVIGNKILFPYNEKGQVSIDKLKGKGDYTMYKQIRSKSVVVAALSLMLLMSACGTTTQNTGNTVPADVSQNKITEAVKQDTKMVKTVMGEVEVPLNPKRVACYHWAGDLLALGITPIASDIVNLAPVKDLLKDAKLWIARDLSTQEELMAMEPDLIVISSQEEYDTYSQIAPCIIVPYETPLDERMKLWGEIFEKETEAEQTLNTFEDKIDKYKKELQEAGIYGKSIAISVVRNEEGNLNVCGDKFGYGAEIIYDMLDFKIPDIIQTEMIDKGIQITELSWEAVPQYLKDIDYLQVTVYNEADWDSLRNNTVWNSIPAVKNENIIEYSSDYESASLLVLDKALDAYYEQLMKLAKR